MKPKILLTGHYKNYNILEYKKALETAGSICVLNDGLNKNIDDVDGLLVSGGRDVSPSIYGEKNKGSINCDTILDELQLNLINNFVIRKKPILGICRGLQILNVYFKGSLIQDLSKEYIHANKEKIGIIHSVNSIKGSILEKLYGESYKVNSFHHQAIKDIGKNLKATSYADNGMIIESIEHEYLPIIAVQWHPERLCDYTVPDCVDGNIIFKYFIKKF